MFDVAVLKQVFPNLQSLDELQTGELSLVLQKSTVLVAMHKLMERARDLEKQVDGGKYRPRLVRWRCRKIMEDLNAAANQARQLGMMK